MTNLMDDFGHFLQSIHDKAYSAGFIAGHAQGVADANASKNDSTHATASRDTSVYELDLTTRIIGCFRRERINTINDLLQLTRKDLLAIPKFGTDSLQIVINELAKYNLVLKGETPIWIGGGGEETEQ